MQGLSSALVRIIGQMRLQLSLKKIYKKRRDVIAGRESILQLAIPVWYRYQYEACMFFTNY
jgi:hypothetical protein